MRKQAGRLSKIFLSIVFLISFWACDEDKFKSGETPEVRPLTPEEKFLVESSNNFALELLSETAQAEKSNVLLSPVSAAMALGIIGNAGSPEKFENFKYKMGLPQLSNTEIDKAFFEVSHMLSYIDPSVGISFANSIWTNFDVSVNERFYNRVMAYYNTDIRIFGESKTIDKKWVDKWLIAKTGNEVAALKTYDPQSNFKIVNLGTFSGKMFHDIPSQWVAANFHGVDGQESAAAMNFYRNISVSILKNDDVLVMEIPVGNSSYSLSIIMPDSLVENIRISEVSFPETFKTASLLIPDIVASHEHLLNQNLTAFGAEKYLHESINTTFSDPLIQPDLSCVVKSRVSIKGTKINATVPRPLEDLEIKEDVIKINRPFYYLVKEKNSDLIVFEGKFLQMEK